MKDLIHSEWRRFRRLTLIFAGAHALALLFLARLTVLPQLAVRLAARIHVADA